MNIEVIKDCDMATYRALSNVVGGECGVPTLRIYIDPSLPIRTRRMLVIHSVIENYNRGMPHHKVNQLCEFIEDALDKLEGGE